ncbi:MAG: hypothetical protein C0508_18280 [Cyanobacteria bacterium PR.023]|nr:hypothetical protein [Cyanobacteria bacterium PR.023]
MVLILFEGVLDLIAGQQRKEHRGVCGLTLSLILLLAAGLTLPVPAVIAIPENVLSRETLNAFGQMKTSQRILGEFLRFLAMRESSIALSEKQSALETARFVRDISDPQILLDIALAAQMKMSIYSCMPASDMALWKGLYRNCTQRKSVQSNSRCQFLLTKFRCPMPRSASPFSMRRSDILSRQLQALKFMDSYLEQAIALERKYAKNKDVWYSVVVPRFDTLADIDVLADLATGAYCKWNNFGNYQGQNNLFEFFGACVHKVTAHPRNQALDVIGFLRCLSSGGAATSELLDGLEAKVLGLTMSEYDKQRAARHSR